MGLISQKDVSSVSVSEVTGQLARIQSQADGDAAVALLDDYDRLLLNSAITSYSKEKGISISEIAKELGIGRTYLYNLLDSNQIELNRLRIIQNYLGINILGEETIDLFLQDLRKKLNGKSYNSSWVSKCNLIKVDQYYLLEFLLPAMKRQVTFWEHMISISNENDKSIFGNTASHENYKFTKMIEGLTADHKTYTGTILLGKTTPSYDLETEYDGEFPTDHITESLIDEVRQSFMGKQLQTPPIFSAKQIDGKRAYEFARKGETVELKQNAIEIFDFNVDTSGLPELKFSIKCSKGTYIRSIAADFGKALYSGGTLIELRRTASGDFDIKDALTVEEAIKMIQESEI